MIINSRHTGLAAALIASSCICAGAGAQSLSLSYKLDPVNARTAQAAAPVVDRCAGLSWAASLATACIPEGWRRASPQAPSDAASALGPTLGPSDAAAQGRPQAPESAPADGGVSAIELPLLGSQGADARLLRVASGNDPTTGSKSVDLLVRFASKYRLKSTDEGLEVYRFKDVTSENRTQGSGVKGLAVELLFPFQ
ncbi:MAG TPA: hypothetical protein VGP15_13840 [Burkholderiales bacterium]|nr:hypothetical protein [Burkholderiales bacterium]